MPGDAFLAKLRIACYNLVMKKIKIIWGTEQTSPVSKNNYRMALKDYQANLGSIFVPEQTHGTAGYFVQRKDLDIWQQAVPMGDYLITNEPGVQIGVLTADCQPIIFFDPINKIVAIAHAGWRGTVAGIAPAVVLDLVNNFKTQVKDLLIFFGPAAGTCCYEVDHKFILNLELATLDLAKKYGANVDYNSCIVSREQSYFFDVLRYNMLCLQELGISVKNFDLSAHVCTICSFDHCSYRRDGEQTGLQLSLVELNE